MTRKISFALVETQVRKLFSDPEILQFSSVQLEERCELIRELIKSSGWTIEAYIDAMWEDKKFLN